MSDDLLAGWVQKANSGGNRWKKRFVVANFSAASLAWFQDDPAFSLAKYRVKEEALGEVKLRGATIFTADGQPSKVCPLPFLLKIVTADRTQLLCFPTKDQQEKWRAFVARAADPVAVAEAAAAEAAAAAGSGASSLRLPGSAGPRKSVALALSSVSGHLSSDPVDFVGWLLKAAPGWRMFQKRFCILDSEELCLRYYDRAPSVDDLYHVLGDSMPPAYDPEDLPPIEDLAAREIIRMMSKIKPKGSIPLRGASVSTKAWSDVGDAAGMLATSPTFSLTSDSGRVYAFVADTKPEMAEWVARLNQAIDEADRLLNAGYGQGGGGVGAGGAFGLAINSMRLESGSSEEGSGGGGGGDTITQKQAKRLSTVVPFKRAARATMTGRAAGGLPLYASFLQNNKSDRAAGYAYKVDKSGKRWAYRYFVLRGSTCSYYSDHTRRQLKGSFTVASQSRFQEGFPPSASSLEPPTEFLFTVSAAEAEEGGNHAAREHYLAANSAAEVRAWLDVIAVLVSAHRAKDGIEAFDEDALAKIEGRSGGGAGAGGSGTGGGGIGGSSSSSARTKSGGGADDEDDGVGELVGLDVHDEDEEEGAATVVARTKKAATTAGAGGGEGAALADEDDGESARRFSASLTAALRLGKSSSKEEEEEGEGGGLGSVPEDREVEGAAATVAPSKPRSAPAPTGRFARVSVGGEDL